MAIGSALGGILGGAGGSFFGGPTGGAVGSLLGSELGKFLPFKKGGKVLGKKGKPVKAILHGGEYVLPAGVKPTKAQKMAVAKLHKK
jgi:hypothetical protein